MLIVNTTRVLIHNGQIKKERQSKSGRGHASWHTVVYQLLGSLVGMIALLFVAPFVPGLKVF